MSEQTSFSIYACSLRKQWLSTIQRDCYGCEFDRSSQLDHDKCCMLELEEQLETYYYQARLAVNEDAILAIIMMETGETHLRSEQLLKQAKDNHSALRQYLLRGLHDWSVIYMYFIVCKCVPFFRNMDSVIVRHQTP